MSTLTENTLLLATRIGQEIKAVRTEAAAIAAAGYTKAEADAAIDAAIAGVLNGAPGALDTLNELAAALGNEADFAATITNALALKANASDVSASLDLKANSADVYTQSQTNTAISNAIAPLALNPRLTINLQTSTGSITTDPVIATAMSTIGNTNGYTVNLGFGEYREPGPIVIDNKWQLQLVGPQSAGTTAATIKNGITIQNSNGVRMTRVQVEGATNISCRAGLGLYFEKVQLMGNVTLGGTGGFMMFVDTDFGGDVAISPTFAGAVYFVRCSFSKAAGVYNFAQSSPVQAIFSDSTGIPNTGIAKASYSGLITYKNNSQAFFMNGVAISTAGATSGQVLKFNGTAFVPAADATSDVTKAYVDAGLAAKADASAVYTKSESDLAISTAINDLVGVAPGTLDTLAEIAAAIENDQTAAAALTQQVALKANSADVYTKSEVDAAIAAIPPVDLSGHLALSGGQMSGEIDMGFNKIVGLADPEYSQDAAHKQYVDDGLALKVDAAAIGDLNANFVATFEAALN